MPRKKLRQQKEAGHAKMLSALREAAAAFPEHAGRIAIAPVPKKAAGTAQRCVLWGEDPVTGERVCLKWEPV